LRCAEGEKKTRPKDAVACVNQECLTERDTEYQIPDAHQGSFRPVEKEEQVRKWIKSEILYQEAKRQKLDRNEKVRSLIRKKVKEIVVDEFVQQKLKDKIGVTEEEARKHFQENRHMYVWGDDYVRISHIFTQGMTGATLADLLIKEGNRFEDVVTRASEDASTKRNGGDLGFVRIRDLSPEIAKEASGLMIGETSPPVATPYGHEIIRVTERRQKGSPMQFEWAKEEIINTLAFQYRQREIDALFEQAAQRARIETFDWASGITLDEIR
jgi:parvulin-like peptidyl-prolyl isomerase